MKIAIFDYLVTPNNAIGNCHRRMMQALCDVHDFTLFSCTFDNPVPSRIQWIRVPALARPLAALFITFHCVAAFLHWRHGASNRRRFALVQSVESNFLLADVILAQFCHRFFLARHWANCGVGGFRGALRWADHYLHALVEPIAFRRAKRIVVPSRGLQRELAATYPFVRDKLVVIPNQIDPNALLRPADFPRDTWRQTWGAGPDDLLLSFVALGHYERKGLPALLEAMALRTDLPLKLVVIGGQPDLVREYERRCARMGLSDRVRFAGMQQDTRPFFWAADAFVFPSFYETFSIVAFEAAAAGCPLVVPELHGVEEFLVDGETGILIRPDAASVGDGLARLAALSPAEREEMVRRAGDCVRRYDLARAIEGWRDLYADLSEEIGVRSGT